MIDTHAHIYLPQFDEDISEVIARHKEAGVDKVYLPNIDVDSIDLIKELVARDPSTYFPMMGLHPCSVKEDYKVQLDVLEKELFTGNYVAVGEIGIDLYWDKSYIKEQEEAYRRQIAWSRELNLPFVVHSRDSLDDTIGIAEELQDGSLSGIYHCFNGTIEQARRIIALGFYMGIGGVVTFKNAGVDKVVAEVPLEYLVLETDSPYLTPAPFRGKRNEPAYISYVVDKIAEVHGVKREQVINVTTSNAEIIFGKSDNKI